MSGIQESVGFGAIITTQLGVIAMLAKVFARGKKEHQKAVDTERVVCPVTMNGFKAVLENLANEQRQQTTVLREIAQGIAVIRAKEHIE
jgi:hypothetical protein